MGKPHEELSREFVAPLGQIILKAEEEAGNMILYLKASNESEDREEETVDMSALQKAKDYYLQYGVISWDHQHKLKDDPKYIIGEPLDVAFNTQERTTMVKAELYRENEIAKSVWKNALSNARKLGSSIGGGILKKSGGRISEVVWDEVAVTHKPMNSEMYEGVSVVPFQEFQKAVQFMEACNGLTCEKAFSDVFNAHAEYQQNRLVKAMMAGSGVDASQFTGGRALIGESLQGDTVDYAEAGVGYQGVYGSPIQSEDLEGVMYEALWKIMDGEIGDYNDLVAFVSDLGYGNDATQQIVRFIASRVPGVADSLR